MTVKRICVTLIVGVLVLAGVRLIVVDQRILIDQASQNATQKITKVLSGLPLKSNTQESRLRITGASPRTQTRVTQRFNTALTSEKRLPVDRLLSPKSTHLKFKIFANTHQLSSYHYWEFEPIQLAQPSDLNAALRQLGIHQL